MTTKSSAGTIGSKPDGCVASIATHGPPLIHSGPGKHLRVTREDFGAAGFTVDRHDGRRFAAMEIEGLGWLVNSPKVETVVFDARGYPLCLVTPDPRAFALHKLWLAERMDRDPLKRRRDAGQGQLVKTLLLQLLQRLPHLRFDDPVLGALPKGLRSQAIASEKERNVGRSKERRLEPDW